MKVNFLLIRRLINYKEIQLIMRVFILKFSSKRHAGVQVGNPLQEHHIYIYIWV